MGKKVLMAGEVAGRATSGMLQNRQIIGTKDPITRNGFYPRMSSISG